MAGIAENRTLPLPAGYPALPYAVSEHSAHTTATFSTLNSTYDSPYEASRLAAQIVAQASSGWETYVFKFSACELSVSSSPNPGCVPNTTSASLQGSMCGVQKTGIHWCGAARASSDSGEVPFLTRACRSHGRGEVNYPPYPVSDTTLAGEAAGAVIRALVGNKTLVRRRRACRTPSRLPACARCSRCCDSWARCIPNWRRRRCLRRTGDGQRRNRQP